MRRHQSRYAGVSQRKDDHISILQAKRARCKETHNTVNNAAFVYHSCGHQCAAAVGLVSHI